MRTAQVPRVADLRLHSSALATRPGNAITVDSDSFQAVDDFLKDMRVRGSADATAASYRQTCAEFLRFVRGMALTAIRPRDIRAYLGSLMARGASPQTLRHKLCVLRSFFRFAEAVELVQVSPARAVQTRRVRRNLPKFLAEEQVDKLIAAGATLRDRAILEFFYSTGCRIAEVAGVRIDDVNFSDRSVKVLGKGDKERIVPMSTRAIECLRAYIGDRTEGWLFQAEGQPDQRGSVTRSSKDGWWLGLWRTDYRIENSRRYPGGRLCYRWKTTRLGRLHEISREEARRRLDAIVGGNLTSRPRPIKAEPLGTRAIREIVYKAGRAAGLGNVFPHQLRHSYATHLHENGADILSISQMLGHASIATTQIYTHVSQKTMRKTLEKFHPHWQGKR